MRADAGGATGGDDADAPLSQLFAGTSDKGVDRAGVAVDKAAADRVGGVGGYRPRRLHFEVHARELGRLRDQGVQGDIQPGEYRAAEVASLAVHGLDGRGRAYIHYDRREPVVAPHRHSVDDPVSPDRPRVVVAVFEAGLHTRVHGVVGDVEDLPREVPVRAVQPGHDARDYHGAHPLEPQPLQG